MRRISYSNQVCSGEASAMTGSTEGLIPSGKAKHKRFAYLITNTDCELFTIWYFGHGVYLVCTFNKDDENGISATTGYR
jgi:hypothetical protein